MENLVVSDQTDKLKILFFIFLVGRSIFKLTNSTYNTVPIWQKQSASCQSEVWLILTNLAYTGQLSQYIE